MRLTVKTECGFIIASAECDGAECTELVRARGKTLPEAIENLIGRFKELQDETIVELRATGFIRTAVNIDAPTVEGKEPS